MDEQVLMEALGQIQSGAMTLAEVLIGFGRLLYENPVPATKAFGGLVALSSLVSNYHALREVQLSIVSCTRELNFTGLDIGRSDVFVPPLRQLLFAYVLFVFYQIVSQVTGAAGTPTMADITIDFCLHAFLVLVVYLRWRSIVTLANDIYESEGKKLQRFHRTLDKALADKKISVTELLQSIVIFPIAALTPKIVEIFVVQPRDVLPALALP